MLHRRLVAGLLAGEALDEVQFGVGLVIRGSHSILLGRAATVARLSRQMQSRLYSPLYASFAPLTGTTVQSYIQQHNTSLSFIRTPLPVEVELASLYLRLDGNVTVRLAHSYGVNETDAAPFNAPQGVTVDLSTLFTLAPFAVQERSLTDNADRAAVDGARRKWKGRVGAGEVERNVRDRRGAGLWADQRNVTVLPMEVRTFKLNFA